MCMPQFFPNVPSYGSEVMVYPSMSYCAIFMHTSYNEIALWFLAI